ncbi:hypothetical protein BO82DRAFT_120892 [Aspergillus uvarum CBS 121591]|uniref:Secreted protein n=1 Tax=Aspergillus uvarum CBS 121591 TaxID=1448315 RepID=A0A319CWC5_9EURO|nr:hypothetical protein BO82DRAFT_120892 [Aspergillus uvarum CBS 121591]PYH79898.1 hypothetical protein BO82DRAFT_120892 [Aspergillus uvarum CBS 121591]
MCFPGATPVMGSCIRLIWTMLSSLCSCVHSSGTADLSSSRSRMVSSVVGLTYAKPLYSRRSPHHVRGFPAMRRCLIAAQFCLRTTLEYHMAGSQTIGQPTASLLIVVIRIDVSMVATRILVIKDRHKQRSPMHATRARIDRTPCQGPDALT